MTQDSPEYLGEGHRSESADHVLQVADCEQSDQEPESQPYSRKATLDTIPNHSAKSHGT